jgi:RND family efflux transporter MFP subunit
MYRVSADTTLEGQIQRVVAAPFDGFVAQSLIRPGDAVAEGAVLARLDDRDLRLELAAWRSRLKQYQTEFERSLAQHNRASVAVVQAQMEEAVSQITLMEHKIARTVITAPFEALVIQGDLSQSLGLAVKQGQELFRLAPLSSYRLVVFVDERDMADIRTGQKGNLVLAAHPEDIYPITVERITPVSVAGQGRNTFRVEAEVQGAGRELRPGMTGVAKIQIEDRLLIWIWTRRFVHWLRLQIWSWLP